VGELWCFKLCILDKQRYRNSAQDGLQVDQAGNKAWPALFQGCSMHGRVDASHRLGDRSPKNTRFDVVFLGVKRHDCVTVSEEVKDRTVAVGGEHAG
jgi:hypothetical protein